LHTTILKNPEMVLMPAQDKHQFQVVRNTKLGAQISHQLVEAIVSGRYKPGDQLPPERDLAVMFETSRVAVREALGALIAKGILSTRQGSGTTVNPTEQWNTLDPVILMLRDGDQTLDQLHEVRRIIEPELAALAAQRITPEELEALRQLVDLPLDDTIEQHIERDTNFHVAIARVTKNTVLQIVLSSIGDLLRESRRRSFIVPGELAAARNWHRMVFEAIERHDPEAARLAMVEHMGQVGHSLDSYKVIGH
jgi:GntR family transcriptional regulator, transcriptional repressor for pyruvate dehydrogenase complex